MSSSGDVRTWYDAHYRAKGAATMRPEEAYAHLLDQVGPLPEGPWLDVSCGTGHLLEHLAERRSAVAVGVDLSPEAVRVARGVARSAMLAVGAGEALCFRDGIFDVVSCLGSLEHFLDRRAGLAEMRRVATPGARFVLMVPNRDFLPWRLMARTGTAQQDVHEELQSLSEWRREFEAAGFRVLRLHPDRWHAMRWRLQRRARPMWRVRNWLQGVAWRLLPLRWQYQLLFVLTAGPPAPGR